MTELVRPEVRRMAGTAALPRQNGMALAVVQERGLDWGDFRDRLIAAIDADPTRPYYESWTAALTDLVVDLGVAGTDEVDARAARVDS